MSAGDDIHRVVLLMEKLYLETGVLYFKAQCQAWSQWVWMLSDHARKRWNVTYLGSPNGDDVCLAQAPTTTLPLSGDNDPLPPMFRTGSNAP